MGQNMGQLKQNMSQLSNKTWVNSLTKHGSTHKQNMSQLSCVKQNMS